jgi:hypothetical protein
VHACPQKPGAITSGSAHVTYRATEDTDFTQARAAHRAQRWHRRDKCTSRFADARTALPRAAPPQDSYSQRAQVGVISRARAGINTALVVGSWLSLGFLRTETAWMNTLALAAVVALFLGGNSAVLKWRATIARHKRRKAEAELLKSQ